ncbi:methyltransferase [Actinomycetaceae bacterium TAE3-ERU4]|nr:methyltransferase [Actinomycetaceae bacterium TAE3-ERU4]
MDNTSNAPVGYPTRGMVSLAQNEPELQKLRTDLAGLSATDFDSLFTAGALAALEMEIALPARAEATAIVHEEQKSGRRRAAALALLFCLGGELTQEEAKLALVNSDLETLRQVGLLEKRGEKFSSRFHLRPYQIEVGEEIEAHYWIASDLPQALTGKPLKSDHVLGIGGATRSLLRLSPREKVKVSLDLGTGCGIQALVTALHSERVVATDISRRALDLAKFNSELNQQKIELRRGNLLEPVKGERFDLIVSNPPFVITPRKPGGQIMEYRDGGAEGDSLVLTLLRELPNHLKSGGKAVMLANWLHPEGQDWKERLQTNLPAGHDAWIMQREVYDAPAYANMWLKDGGLGTPQEEKYGKALVEYLEFFNSERATHIGFGYVLLRALESGQTPLIRLEDTAEQSAPAGADLTAWCKAADWLREQVPDLAEEYPQLALSENHLKTTADVIEVRYQTPGEEDPRIINLVAGNGRKMQAGQAFAALVGACDGELSLGQITNALSNLLETPVEVLAKEMASPIIDAVLYGIMKPETGTV